MRVYLASPGTQQQAEHVGQMPVLLSFAFYRDNSGWLSRYAQGFGKVLIDSGAYAELRGGESVCLDEYVDFASEWSDRADAIAGLDDISGDWRRSLRNFERVGFPTFHDTDPEELLPDLIDISRERGNWLGIGLLPPRSGREDFLRRTLERIPEDIHVHGWALRAYTKFGRLDSVDSTNWWRDGMKVRKDLPWLNYGECLEIVVKRYARESRIIESPTDQKDLFAVGGN